MGKLRFLKSRLQRLERDSGSISIVQKDGSTFRTERMDGWVQMFLYLSNSLRAIHHGGEYPEPPPVLLAVVNAKDRRSALEQVLSGKYDMLPVEVEALIERGELIPRPMVVDADGRMYGVGEVVEDLSE